MKYHLETIPVWEAVEKDCECHLCALRRQCETTEIERSLGGSVMEPDARIRINENGICSKHHQQLFDMKNRLGHALLTDSHTKDLLQKLNLLDKLVPVEKKGLFGGKADSLIDLADALERLTSTCVICDDIDAHMQRYLYTFIHLWKTDSAFRSRWQASKGVCLPHAVELLYAAQKHLSGALHAAFAQELLRLLRENLSQDEKDLEWFTLKFDYRNQDKPWGNSRNALERTINRLRGDSVHSDTNV